MKRHNKRLLKAAAAVAVLGTVTGRIFYPLFAVDAGSLTGAVSYLGEGAAGTTRVLGQKDFAEIGIYASNPALAEEFQLVLENGECELYFREDNGEIALKRKGAENIWYSNPQDRESETMLSGSAKAVLGSQLSLSYFASNKQGYMDSYNDCVAYGALESTVQDGRLAVTYHFGKDKITVADLPQQVRADRWEGFLENAGEEAQKALGSYYTLLSKSKMSEKVFKTMLERYPKLEEYDLYYLNIDGKASERALEKIKGYLDEIGYTTEDLVYDNEQAGIAYEVTVHPRFDIVLEYWLEEESLVVRMDTEKITYPEGIPIYQIDLLKYFGAGGTEEEGYLFYPDGSGSLIYFNHGRTASGYIEMGIYGEEETTSQTSHYQMTEGIKLPVYGIQRGKEALFAQVAEGASKMSLKASVSGISDSYNTIYPKCNYIMSKLIKVTEAVRSSGTVVTEKNPYAGAYEIRFTALLEEESGYVGMARYYRQELLGRGELRQADISDALPMAVSMLGGTTTEKIVLGVTVTGVEAMTGYQRAGEIAKELKQEGADGIVLRYLGWFNGGMDQSYAGRVKLLPELGGKKGFEGLIRLLEEEGIPFYPEVSFLKIDKKGDGFRTSSMNARGISRDILVGYHYNAVSRTNRTDQGPIYRLKPAKLLEETEQFLKKYSYAAGISAGDLGNFLYADYDDKTPCDREMAKGLAAESLERLGEGNSLMVADPNLYALGQADILVDVPCDDSWMELEDLAVPFYQMVVRGSVDYVAKPLNYESDYQTAFLRAIEYGAGLNYLLMEEGTALLKGSDFDQFYTGAYREWKETIVQDYRRASEALDALQGQQMVGHRQIGGKVFCTYYQDGTKVIVNYGEEEAVAEGVAVGKKDFKVVKE